MLQGAGWQQQVAAAHRKTISRAGRGLNTVGNTRAELSTKAAEAIWRRIEGQPSPEYLKRVSPSRAWWGTRWHSQQHTPTQLFPEYKSLRLSCGQNKCFNNLIVNHSNK